VTKQIRLSKATKAHLLRQYALRTADDCGEGFPVCVCLMLAESSTVAAEIGISRTAVKTWCREQLASIAATAEPAL